MLHAALIKPRDFDPARKYPVLVYLYGGPHVQLVRDQWQGANFLWNQMMAQKGFVIFTVDNRGSTGRGHAFESAIFRRFGEAELADQLAGVNWLKRQSYVDGERIGIWGWSFGGYMTCLAMLRAGDTFKAGFAGAPVTDWRYYDTIYTERYMGTAAGQSQRLPRFIAGELRRPACAANCSSPTPAAMTTCTSAIRWRWPTSSWTRRNTPSF